jgi:membrane-associated protein
VYTHDYRWLNKDALRRTHDFFEKHGGKTIVLARFVPVVRTFAPLVAGVSEMPHSRFQLYNISGALLWVVSLTMAGYFFGNIPVVRDHLSEIVMVAVGVVMIPILLGGAWRLGRSMLGR